MRNFKGVVAVLGIGLALGITYVTPHVEKVAEVNQTFPPSVCPGLSTNGSTYAHLPSSKIKVRSITTKSIKFIAARARDFHVIGSALLVSGNPSTSVTTSSFTGDWFGSAICSVGGSDQWFVGGSAGITSTSRLDLVNSGLSDAIVELTIYTSKPTPIKSTISVKANSDKAISLDALAPGESSLVIHALTRSGRVSSFLFDQQHKGLKSIGMDYVNPILTPSTTLVIPAVTNSPGKNNSISHFLRILAPGNLDASLKVTIHSAEGDFTPLGFDQRSLSHGRVFDLLLPSLAESTPFALELTSDQPIVGALRSALTSTSNSDFAWATPAPRLGVITMNLGGTTPTFVFSGESIRVAIRWTLPSGKVGTATAVGSQVATWKPMTGINQVTLTSEGTITSAGLIFLNPSPANFGLSYLPVMAGSEIESATMPVTDAHVISRG